MRASSPQYHIFRNSASASTFNYLEGVALNASAATRTITLDLKKSWSKVEIYVFFTHSAATDVSLTASTSLDGTNFASYTSRAIVAGASTVSALVDTNPVSGDENFKIPFDVKGAEKLKIVFAGTSGGASDLINVQAIATVGE